MVVLNVSEDIEAKIRRLRELGKASTEAESQPVSRPPKATLRKPPRKPRGIGSIRDKERRKKILIGAGVLITVIILVAVGALMYFQSHAANQLQEAKNSKIAEVNQYYKAYSLHMNTTYGQNLLKNTRSKLLSEISSASSVDQVKAVDVKGTYAKAYQQYKAYLQEQERIKFEQQLNATKREKIQNLTLEFQPLLAQPLPDSIRAEVVDSLKSLEESVNNASSMEGVARINAAPYLLKLWRDYYDYRIDSVPTQSVVLIMPDGTKKVLSKTEAKAYLAGISDYRQIIRYSVQKVEYVDIALVLSRDRINGAFLSPGDHIVIFAKNSSSARFQEIVNQGYIELVLLPKQAGLINLNEAQSQSSSSSSSSSSQYSRDQSSTYQPGGTTISNGQSSSDTYSNSQSASQSVSAVYSYSTDLTQILKALAAGKLKNGANVEQQLENYGWEVIDLEKSSGLMVVDPNAQFLVIVKVPSIFVPDILSYQQYLYLAKVTG